MPKDAPKSPSPIAVTAKFGSMVAPKAATMSPSALVESVHVIVRAAPSREMRWLDVTRPAMEPTAMANASNPIVAVSASKASRTLGIRETQVDRATPQLVKIAKMALRHATTWRRDRPPA